MFTVRLLGSASLEGPDGPVAGRAALRQRIALLALLAVEHPRPLSRDKLIADLWPESGTGDARHLLRESLYILRSALGEDSVLSTGDDLRLNPDRLTCDLWEFEAALARDDLEAAVGIYHGPFLSGFHLSDAEQFEHWADGERSRLARRYGQALEQLAERETKGGDPLRAGEWWSRLAREDPYNSRIALCYMQALEAAGDRAAALRHATAHSELLRTDLDAVPEREVVAFAERLRLESRPATGAPTTPVQPSAVSIPLDGDGRERPTSLPAEPRRPIRRRWIAPTVLILAMVAGVGVLGGVLSRERPPELSSHRVAAAVFENHTGRPDLDDLGILAADWIIRGVMETPLVEATDVEAVYARGKVDSGYQADPLTQARRDGAGIVVRGSYYLSGDSVLFLAGILDVGSGRLLRSFEPVGAPLQKATTAFVALRERIAAGLSPLVSPLERAGYPPVDPDLVPPPSLPAYREFVAGLKQRGIGDWGAEAEHYRRAARLDSTFVAPLIQLAFSAMLNDECSITDSVATVLDQRRETLTEWDRLTIDLLRARCRGDRATEVDLLEQRFRAYPRSALARGRFATGALQPSNQPRAAREILRPLDPGRDRGSREIVRQLDLGRDMEMLAWYWWHMAACWHTLGEYRGELDITERWRDSTSWEWQVVRGRALAALGREREVMELLASTAGGSVLSVAGRRLRIATELAVHGHPRMAMAIAESVLAQLELRPEGDLSRTENVVWANRLLGRNDAERAALGRIASSDADTLARLKAQARIAVLLADTAQAERIDHVLREQSERPLRSPWIRGPLILARAHLAAGFGRREQAVALLRLARARVELHLGSSHVFHEDLLLAPLRGYPPFDALLKPDN